MPDTQENNAAARAFAAPKLRYCEDTHGLHAAALYAQAGLVAFARELHARCKETNLAPWNSPDSDALALAVAWLLENTEGGELRFVVQTEAPPLAVAPE